MLSNDQPHWCRSKNVRRANRTHPRHPVQAGGWAICSYVLVKDKRKNKDRAQKPSHKADCHIKEHPRRRRARSGKHNPESDQPVAGTCRQKHPRGEISPSEHGEPQKCDLHDYGATQCSLVRFRELDAQCHNDVTPPNVKLTDDEERAKGARIETATWSRSSSFGPALGSALLESHRGIDVPEDG